MMKFRKTLVALALGVSFIYTSLPSNAVTNATNTNLIVASYSGGNIVLLSNIQPLLPKLKAGQNYTTQQIHQAVNKYISEQLLQEWTAKAKAHIKITDNDVTNAIYDIAARNGLTYDDFLKALAFQGMDINTYKKQIAKTLYQQKFQHYITTNVKSQIDRQSIQLEGFNNYNQAVKDKNIAIIDTPNISYILIKTTPLVSGDQAKKEIDNIYQSIVNKKLTFSEAATKYSNDIISAAQGGELGNLQSLNNTLADELTPIVQDLKVSQYSKPVYLNNYGWAIVKLNSYNKVQADLSYYINQAFQAYIKTHFGQDSLQNYLLNSVIIDYKDFNLNDSNPLTTSSTN